MFDKLVAGLLTSYLGEYFENIDTEQVKVSVWAGNVNLKRLTVRKDALRFFDVPFCIEEGFIDELVVVIPWTHLQSESMVFKMKGVRLVVRRKTYENYPLAQRRKDADVRRQRELEANEAILLEEHYREEADQVAGRASTNAQPPQTDEDKKNSTFSARLRANILNNIKIEMEDLQWRYESTPTAAPFAHTAAPAASSSSPSARAKGSSEAVTFRLASLESFPCNSAYQKTFMTATDGAKVRLMHKMVVIKGVEVVLTGADAVDRPLTASLNAALRVQYQPVPLDRHTPTWLMGAQLDSLSVSLSQEDVQLLYVVVRDMMMPCEDHWDRLQMRPVQTPHINPRAWFRYAIAAVRLELRKRKQKHAAFSWEGYKALKAKRDTYAKLFRRSRRAALNAQGWLTPLSASEEVELLNLEETLPIETITLARRLALARVAVERQEYVALKHQQTQQRLVKNAGVPGAAEPGAAVPAEAPEETGWLKRWWSGGPNPSVERAIEREESPAVRAVMQETVELMSTTRWTEAQRVAIAKEFGLSAQDVTAMTDSGSPTAASPANPVEEHHDTAPKTDTNAARCVFKGVLAFTSADVTLTRRVESTSGTQDTTFAVVHLQGLNVGATSWDNARTESVLCVHDLGIRAASRPLVYVCSDDSSRAIPRQAPTVREQKHHGQRLVARVLQDMDVSLVALAQEQTDGVGAPGLFLWGTTEPPALVKRDEAPHHVHVDVQPLGINVDVPFVHEIVQFFLAAYKHVQTEQDRVAAAMAATVSSEPSYVTADVNVAGTSADDDDEDSAADAAAASQAEEEKNYMWGEMGIVPLTLLPVERRDLADKASRLASLTHKVETAWLVDWSVSLGGLTLLVMEVEGEQGSRIHVRDVQLRNNVEQQLTRASRLAASRDLPASPNHNISRDATDASGSFPQTADTPFGSEESDWVNVFHATVSEYSLSCLYTRGGRVQEEAQPEWHHVIHPMPIQYEIKRNMMSRRNADYPGIDVTFTSAVPVQLSLSRSRLSVLCTSLSFLIDFVQRTVREVMMTRGAVSTTPTPHHSHKKSTVITKRAVAGKLNWGDKNLFRIRVLAVDNRYWTEAHGEAEEDVEDMDKTTEAYLRGYQSAPVQPLEYRYLHVQRGALVIFHAMRPTYPHYCVELIEGHYHVVQSTVLLSGGQSATVVDLYVEQGGCDQAHDCNIADAVDARRYLQTTFAIPSTAFKNMTLLRPFVETCLARAMASGNAPPDCDGDKVQSALRHLEKASHALPCRHFRLHFDDADDAARFIDNVRYAGISRGLFTPTLADYAALADAVPEPIRAQCVVRVAVNAPTCDIDFTEEDPSESPARLTFTPFCVSANQGIQYLRCALETDRVSLTAGSTRLLSIESEKGPSDCGITAPSSSTLLPVRLTCTLHTVPCNGLLPTRKETTIQVAPGHVFACHIRSELIQCGELIWDLVGIVTNRVFSAIIVTATPWWPRDSLDALTAAALGTWEAAWVNAARRPERQQQHVQADFAAVSCDIFMANTKEEWAAPLRDTRADLSGPAALPLLSLRATQVALEWCLDAAVNRVTCDLQSPVVTGPFLAPEATQPFGRDGSQTEPAATHVLGGGRQLLCVPSSNTSDARSKDASRCTIDFSIATPTPVLSLSDFLCLPSSSTDTSRADVESNSESARGYRFTTFVAMTAHHIRALYFQPQLMALLDVGTRGVVERAMAIPNRPAYLFGSSTRRLASAVLPAWPEQWAAMPPTAFNWTLLHKTIRLESCAVVAATTPRHGACVDLRVADLASQGAIVLEAPLIGMCDQLQGSTKRQALSDESASGAVVASTVGITTRIELAHVVLKRPSELSCAKVGAPQGQPQCAMRTMCPDFCLDVALTLPLFDAACFEAGRCRACEMSFAPMLWRTSADGFAQVVECVFHQFMGPPVASLFVPKPFPIVDPFVEAALVTRQLAELTETSRTTVRVPQGCFHVVEAGRTSRTLTTALTLHEMEVTMVSGREGSFTCDVALREAHVWDLSHLGVNAAAAAFRADPSECCERARDFLCLLPAPNKARTAAAPGADHLQPRAATLRLQTGPGVSEMSMTVGVIQLTIVPHFLFDARDGFFSLAMRNAVGLVLRWPPRLPLSAVTREEAPVEVSPVRRRWQVQLGQLRLSLPDVLHNTLSPFVLFSVAGIDLLDETDASGELKEQHVIISQLTRNGMYLYPDELACTGVAGPHAQQQQQGPPAPKLRIFVIPPVPMEQLRAHQDRSDFIAPPRHHHAHARSDAASLNSPLSPPTSNTDLMDALFASPPSPHSTGAQSSAADVTSPPQPARASHVDANASPTVAGPLFSCVHTPASMQGLVVHLSSVWVVVPHRHHLVALSSLWSRGGLSTLAELATFQEDRGLAASSSPATNAPEKRPSLFPRIRVTVDSPALVLPDRDTNPGSPTEVQRGMLLSVGTVHFEKKKERAPESPVAKGDRSSTEHYHRVWRLRVPEVRLCAVSHPDDPLLKPFSIALERWDEEPTAWGWRLHIEKIHLEMEQRYYEMLLQVIVRNTLTAAAAANGGARDTSDHALDFAETLSWFSTGPQTGHALLPEDNQHASIGSQPAAHTSGHAAPATTTTNYLYATAEDELGLRHPFPAYGSDDDEEDDVVSSHGDALESCPTRVCTIQLKMDGVALCVYDRQTAAYMHVDGVDVVSNAEWRLLPPTHDSGESTLPFRAPQRFLIHNRTQLVDRRRQVTARVGRVDVGLQQRQPLLLLVSSPVQHTIEDPTVIDLSAAAFFALDQKNLEETVEGHLGDGTLRLDSSVVATAIDVLYRPYARIVLPSYEVGEVIVLTRDRVLSAPLYLSQRATLRVSGAVMNHVVLNGGGHEIHFLSEAAQGSGGAVLFVDEGVTLRITNALLCFHGNSLDYYVKAGNGGYVAVDRETCTSVSAEEAELTLDSVRTTIASAAHEAGGDVLDTLFGDASNAAASASATQQQRQQQQQQQQPSTSTPAACRRMRRYIVAATVCAEVPEPLYAHRTAATDAPNRTLSRTLVLTAALHCCVVDIQHGNGQVRGTGESASGLPPSRPQEADTCTGTFDLTHFAVHSEACLRTRGASRGDGMRRGDAGPMLSSHTEQTDLLSEWSCQVLYTRSALPAAAQPGGGTAVPHTTTTHAYDVVAKKGLDVHIRYRDLFLCTAALHQATHALNLALGDVKTTAFSDLMGKLNAKSDQGRDVVRYRANAVRAGATSGLAATTAATTTVNLEMAYVDLFLVNDQSAVDVPLFHVRVDTVRTPTSVITLEEKAWTLEMTLSVDFYDLAASAWYPVVEPTPLSLRAFESVSLSVDELMDRKGFRRLEVSVKPVRLYVSPLLLAAVRRAMDVRATFQKEQTQLELYGPGCARAAQPPSLSGSAATTTLSAQGLLPTQFHAVSVRQELGVAALRVRLPSVSTAVDSSEMEGSGYEVEPHEHCAFDYPRVGGKEADRTQQYVRLSLPPHTLVQRVYTFADGVAQVPLGPARLAQHPVVEVTTANGRKEVVVRSNISFVNNLSFPLLLEGGVGCVQPRGEARLHVPVDQLRQRVRFLPNVALKSDDCGLGIRYENLPALRGRTFLCLCPVEVDRGGAKVGTSAAQSSSEMLVRTGEYELRRGVQRHLFFLLKVRDAPHRDAASIQDVVGHFDAPLYVVNHVGLPIELQLMTQRTREGKKVGLLDLSPDFFSYELVGSVTVEPSTKSGAHHTRQDITQLDPFQDIAIDVVVRMPNGAVLGRRMDSRLSAAGPRPACVYAPQNPSRRAERVTLVDPKTGSTLVLTLTYEGNEVHLFCPYWFLNDTSYALQLTDINPEKEAQIPLVAGLQPGTPHDAITPVGTPRQPFLYATERAVQLKEKAHVYVRVGATSQGVPTWTRWSSGVNVFAPVDYGVLCCIAGNGAVMTLSYSVEVGEGRLSQTRLITVRPRWILVNRTPRGLCLRYAQLAASGHTASGSGANAIPTSSETHVASASCHVLYRAPASAAMSSTSSSSSLTGAVGANSRAYMQLSFAADPTSGEVEDCEWSAPFCISDEGEHAFNVRYRGLVKLEDHWPLSANPTNFDGTQSPSAMTPFSAATQQQRLQQPASLPPIRPEDIVEHNKELFLRRSDTSVVSVSCVRRASTTFLVVTDAANPPFVIENRTDFMVWVRQSRLDAAVSVYPKSTKAYTWDSETLPMEMVLWLTDGTFAYKSTSVTINFDPRALLNASQTGFQQEIEMPLPGSGSANTAGAARSCILFVRVRGVHGASYAVSVTTEPTIDIYRTMPYKQFFYRLHMDAIYTVLEDAQHDDAMLLTVRPVHVEYAQGAYAQNSRRGSTGSTTVPNMSITAPSTAFAGDVQRIDVSVQVIQLDDERANAKQKVVAQLVDDSTSFYKYERYMLRSTPILYVPKCAVYTCPIEFHVEDSYLYTLMPYAEQLSRAWTEGNVGAAAGQSYHRGTPSREDVLAGTTAARGWAEEVAALSEEVPVPTNGMHSGDKATAGGGGRAVPGRAHPSWQQRVVFFGRLFVEKVLVSISLYRSPGAQNDPIWERVGALSLLLRSVKDARLEWPRIDQSQVSDVVWVLLTRYSASYRRRFQEQIPSLMNIIGIDNVKGFFNKLVEDPNAERNAVRRQKPRMSRRSEANLLKDTPAYREKLRYRNQLVVKAEPSPDGVMHAPQPYSATHLSEALRQRTAELFGTRDRPLFETPFPQLLRLLSTRRDLLLFGNVAMRIAVLSSAPVFDLANCPRDSSMLRSAENIVAAHDRAAPHTTTTSGSSSRCSRCGEVEALEKQYAAAAMPNPLPHPDEGLITWGEFVHHITWDAFVAMCTVEEIQRYGVHVKDAIVGSTNNVIRLAL